MGEDDGNNVRIRKDSSFPHSKCFLQGTVFIRTNLCDPNPSVAEIRKIFEKFGEILAVRDCRGNPLQKFIEYYSLKASEQAAIEANGMVINGGAIFCEFARPSVNPVVKKDGPATDYEEKRAVGPIRKGDPRDEPRDARERERPERRDQMREPRESRESRDARNMRDVREVRDNRDFREAREMHGRESRPVYPGRDGRDHRDMRSTRDAREDRQDFHGLDDRMGGASRFGPPPPNRGPPGGPLGAPPPANRAGSGGPVMGGGMGPGMGPGVGGQPDANLLSQLLSVVAAAPMPQPSPSELAVRNLLVRCCHGSGHLLD